MPDPFRVVVIFEFSEYERELVSEHIRRIGMEKGIPHLARRRDLRLFVRNSVNSQWLRMGDDLTQLDADEARERHAKETGDADALPV